MSTPARPLPNNPKPVYPAELNAEWREAIVKYVVEVSASGAVTAVRFPGDTSDERFRSAARDALTAWRFEPRVEDGKPTSGIYAGQFEFTLAGEDPSGWMYAAKSADVWRAFRDTLESAGFTFELEDQQNQFLITKRVLLSTAVGRPFADIPLTGDLQATELRFHVFVSPFVEPAHVHVGSDVGALSRSIRVPPTGSLANRGVTIGDVPGFAERLLDRVAPLVGKGRPLPLSTRRRRQLARSLAPAAIDRCGQDSLDLALARADDPARAPGTFAKTLHSQQPDYPYDQLRERRDGLASVKGIVLEDGSVLRSGVLRKTDDAFLIATDRALSHWRMTPASSDGCPVPILLTFTMTFAIR